MITNIVLVVGVLSLLLAAGVFTLRYRQRQPSIGVHLQPPARISLIFTAVALAIIDSWCWWNISVPSGNLPEEYRLLPIAMAMTLGILAGTTALLLPAKPAPPSPKQRRRSRRVP